MYPAAGKAPLLRIEACSRWAAVDVAEQGGTATSSVAAQIRQSPGRMRSTVHHSGASPSGSKDQSASAAGGGIVHWCEQETSPRAGGMTLWQGRDLLPFLEAVLLCKVAAAPHHLDGLLGQARGGGGG